MVSPVAAIFAQNPVLQALWGFLVVNGLKGLVFFVLAWSVLKLCRGLSSELRHLVWLLVIVSSVVFPAVWLVAPDLRLTVPVAVGRSAARLAAVVPFTARVQFGEIMTVPGMDSVIADYRITLLRRILPWLLGSAWVAGTLFFLQRLVVGRLLASLLLRRALPARIEPLLLSELCRELGIERQVTAALCPDCGVPFTFGVLHPVILLPETARRWPAERLRSVLIHELTHVRRRECLYNSAAAVICALLWFLPVPWLAYSAMRREAEKSSDQAVLQHGIPRTSYASDLVELVHDVRGLVLAASAVIPLGRTRFIRERIVTVLAERRERLSRPLKFMAAALTVVFCGALAVLAFGAASLPADRPLTGSWVNPESTGVRRSTWTPDGRVFVFYRKGSATPSLVGFYTIEGKWTDEEGSTWYHVIQRTSPPPYRDSIKLRSYNLIKVDAEGTRLEINLAPSWYAAELTSGWHHVLYRETRGKQ